MAENAFSIDSAEAGILAAITALTEVARTTMFQQLQQRKDKDTFEPFMGFVQALVEHRNTLAQQILVKLMNDLEEAGR